MRARIDELEARLRSLEAMLRTGQYAALRAAWQPLAAELETIDFAPLRARGANLEARLFGGLKQAGPAEKASRAAIQQAARAGDDRLAALGWINLIELLGQFEGDLDRALALQPVAEAALARAGDPDDLRADLLDALGNLHRDRGEYREAIELGEQALAAAEKGEQGPLQVARVHNNLALDAERAGQPEVAARHLTRSLALLEGELGPGHPSLAAVLTNLGINAEARGALDAAETYHRRALAIRVETFGKDHPDVATPLENLALLAERRGRSAEGIDSMRRALEIRAHAFGEDDRRTADARMNLAALLDQPDQADEAERLILRAEETYRKKLPAGHDVFATVRGALAHVAKRRGDIDRALLLYREGLALARARLGPGHPGLAQWQQDIGLMLHRQGRFEEARVELEAALAAWRQALGPDHPDVAMALLNLGNIERELDQPGRALRHYREAHDIYQKTQDPLMVAFSLEATAAAARLTGDCAEARRAGREALDLFARLLGTEAHEIGLVRDTFGQCALANGEVAAAIAELEAAAVLLVGRDLAVDRAHAGLALAQARWQAGHRRAAVAAARATLDAVRGHDGADVARARGQVAAWLARHAGPQAPGTTPR